MKRKWVPILISGLLIIGCLAGCSNEAVNSSAEPESASSSSTTAPADISSSEGKNFGEETSDPVFDYLRFIYFATIRRTEPRTQIAFWAQLFLVLRLFLFLPGFICNGHPSCMIILL